MRDGMCGPLLAVHPAVPHTPPRDVQDAIMGGRPGKREQCEAAARAALAASSCALIDRTHLTAQHREPFVALAASQNVAAHCVTLVQVCAAPQPAKVVRAGSRLQTSVVNTAAPVM
jgi:hypothetical protein